MSCLSFFQMYFYICRNMLYLGIYLEHTLPDGEGLFFVSDHERVCLLSTSWSKFP